MFLSLLCATYVFTCHSQSSLTEFPECWVKPAAELSMSTSDAFTVPCSQPSEYFPEPSLAWLLHSASSQAFAIACVCPHTYIHTHTHIQSYLLTYTPLPPTVESSCLRPFSPVGFLPLIYSSILFPLWLTLHPSLFSNYLFFSGSLFFSFFFSYPLPLPFALVSQPWISPLLYDHHPLQLSFPSSPLTYLSLIACHLLHFPPLSLAHPLLPLISRWW